MPIPSSGGLRVGMRTGEELMGGKGEPEGMAAGMERFAMGTGNRAAHLLRAAAVGIAAVVMALALAAAPASAGQTHVLLGAFCEPTGIGAAPCAPSFGGPMSATVDQSSGDVLVIEAGANRISRYHADGTPSNFSALGTHVIDGAGPGADETPQNGLSFDSGFGNLYSQLAVDDSGTASDGNIYVTQNLPGGGTVQAIEIFAASGEYLGRLSGAGGVSFAAAGSVSPCGVAVDPTGNVYVGGWREDKVYKYDPSANPPVDGDHVASFDSPEPCQLAAGVGASAGSIFATEYTGSVTKLNSSNGALEYVVFAEGANDFAGQLALNPVNGHIFVATTGGSSKGIREFDASQTSGPIAVSVFGGERVVAVDGSSGRVYGRSGSNLLVYSDLVPLPDAFAEPASNIEETSATLNGKVETFGEELTECFFEYGTTTAYGSSVPCAESFAQIGTGTSAVHADLAGLGGETRYHYRLIVGNANGRGAPGGDVAFQTKSKPELVATWSEQVGLTEATLKAQINPQSAATSYRFEWGLSGAPYEHVGEEVAIGAEPDPQTVSLSLRDLEPGRSYRFRVVAENEMGVSVGAEHAFTTFAPPVPPQTNCPNQAFRSGDSALLPDCRAYELVSPVDKNGTDILKGLTGNADPPNAGGRVQVRPDGNKLTYTTVYATFCGQANGFKFNQYVAERGAGGWSCEGINQPVAGGVIGADIFGLFRAFMAFTPDLCSAWLLDTQTPPVSAEGHEDYPNLYRRENCGAGAGSLEALAPSPPALPAGTPENYVDRNAVQGVSADGRHAFFTAEAKLTPDAHEEAPGVDGQIYDRFGGGLSLVSVLPNGASGDPAPGDGKGFADPANAQLGSGKFFNLKDAVSQDGSRVYWTSGLGVGGGPGRIYLRQRPEEGIVAGECSGAAACTRPVSTGADAMFMAAKPDGSAALYSEGSLANGTARLLEYSLQRVEERLPPRRVLAEDVRGVAGVSEDLSRIYFASPRALAGSGPNSEGDQPVEGEPNLYLGEGGTMAFVATLARSDVEGHEPGAGKRAYSPISPFPIERASRVTPDGARIAFNSRASLTGYDNTDTQSGKAVVEVFTYEAGGQLDCVSCNPSGARPRGARELKRPYLAPFEHDFLTNVPAAAWIPTWEHPQHASNVISEDGGRIFFNANDALLPRDANGAQDVYQWEVAGSGSCKEGDADYFAANGGCLHLISSGESRFESEFWGASPDGDDVFFTTASSLLPQDPGSVDLYDARVGGGFPGPEQRAQCEGEACQSPPPAPEFPAPASGAYRGPGNLAQTRSCRGHGSRAAKLSRRAKDVRRAARRAQGAAAKRRMARKAGKLSRRATKASKHAKRCRAAMRRAGR